MNHLFSVLAFEAGTQVCSVAVKVGKKVFYRLNDTPKKASNFLLPMIDAVLKEAHISIPDLHAIAVGHGPGSFMGIRLAVGVAQGLAYPQNIPVIGVSTLHILAQTAYARDHVKSVLTAWDARMQEIYYGGYQLNENNIMVSIVSDQLTPPSQLKLPEKKYTLVGNGWSVYYEKFSYEFQEQVSKDVCDQAWIYPTAKALLVIANDRLSRRCYTTADQLYPVYLRDQVAAPSDRQQFNQAPNQ
jgi:tRNA threonylcarbamoyladenosine biosynthesis protein TsaB